MENLPKLIVGLILFISVLVLLCPKEVDADVLASQTQSYANLGTAWSFAQVLGSNLSGLAQSITVRLATSNTIDFLAQNSFLVDQTNNYQIVTLGCTTAGVNTSDQKRFLTITTGGSVPTGFEDVTIDLSCANYSFIQGHTYLFVWQNANTYNTLTFAAHRGSHTDHQDFFTGGGIYYDVSGSHVIPCFPRPSNALYDIAHYVQNCYSWDNDQKNSAATDDLYFVVNGIPPPPPRLAVIFIPGIGGSELTTSGDVFWSQSDGHEGTFSHAYSSGEKIWVNQNEAAALGDDDYFDVLRLKPDGQTSEAPLSLNGYLTPYGYGEVDSFFQNDGYTKGTNYFVFPYDWRFDVTTTAQALDNLVEQAKQKTGQSKVIIVAHSLGGLVARNYISDATKAAKVDKLIELGVPHLGAVDSLKGLLHGKSIDYTFKFFNIPVIPASEIKDLLQNLPSMYELVPSANYFNFYSNSDSQHPYPLYDERDVDNNGIKGSLTYTQTKTLLSDLNYNMTVFNIADSFHASIDPNLNQLNGVNLYEIAGSGIPTLGQIKETWWVSWPFDLIPKTDELDIDGDGTVPVYSASLRSSTLDLAQGAEIYYVPQRHEDLPRQNGDAMQIVKKILAQDNTLVANQKFSLEGTQISADGADIDLYDSSGNHTGLKSDGSVEENIPDTFYSGSENTKNIFVKKTAPKVTVKTKSSIITSSSGSTSKPKKVAVKLKNYTSDIVQNVTVYPPIGVTDTSETDFTLDPQSSTPPALITYPDPSSATTGTGGIATDPVSQVSNTDALDQTPPTTSVTVTGDEDSSGNFSGSATITITPSDSESGILETDYSLDNGQTVQTYSSPVTVTTIGTSSLQIFSTDKAGNQEMPQSLSFIVVPSPTPTTITNTSDSSGNGGDSSINQSSNDSSTPSSSPTSNIAQVTKAVKQIISTVNPKPRNQGNVLAAKTFPSLNPLPKTLTPDKEIGIVEILKAVGLTVGFLSLGLGLSFAGSLSFPKKP